jgi:hypothetical protein
MCGVSTGDVEAFLTSYESALSAYDANASAALWGLPGTMITDDFAGSLDSRELMAQGLTQSYPLYQALGMSRVGHTVVERADLTDRIVRLRVRWHFYDDGGEHLVDGDYEYLLRRDDDGLHVYVAVAIDEAQRLTELAQRRGIDLSQFFSPAEPTPEGAGGVSPGLDRT